MEVDVCAHGCGKTSVAIPVGKMEETEQVIEMKEVIQRLKPKSE